MKLLNLLRYLFLFLVPSIAAAKNIISSCDWTESYITNCLQQEVYKSAKLHKTLILKPGNYALTAPLLLISGVSINGNGSVFTLNYSKPNQPAFYGESVVDVIISNLKIDGNGYYTESKIINPYHDSARPFVVGFSNTNNGIAIYGKSSKLSVKNVAFVNLHHGIYLDAVISNNYSSRIESVLITNSIFSHLGKAAIFIRNASRVSIESNIIENISGNFASGVKPELGATAWADGIYVRGLQNSMIKYNNIRNIRRIGVVLEGETDKDGIPITLNDNVNISDNNISNLYLSKGTEYNAGIWVEPYNNKFSNYYKTNKVYIYNNVVDNNLAKVGAHPQFGVRLGAKYNNVFYNTIINFSNQKSVGVSYSYGVNLIESNSFSNNTKNIFRLNDNKDFTTLILK